MNILKPPLYPKMHTDESPLGYLKRLAHTNSYYSYKWLLTPSSKESRQDGIMLEALKLCDWSGANSAYGTQKFVENLPYVHASLFIRFCPLCLQESEYWKAGWYLKTAFCCSKHQIWLEDKCYHCGQLQNRLSKVFLHCTCGMALYSAKPRKCPESVIQMQLFLENEKFEGRQELENLMPANHNLTLFQRIKLLELIARRVPNHAKLKRGMNIHLNTIETGKDAVIDTANALFAGRGGFMAFLSALQAMGRDNTTFVYDRFTLFYRDFYNTFEGREFDGYKKELEKFVNARVVTSLSRRNRLFSEETIRGHYWLPLEQAVREFKIPKSKLLGAINAGWIDAQKEEKGERDYILVNRPNLESRCFYINEQLTFMEAAIKLGVTRPQLHQLIAQGELKDVITPQRGGCSVWRISACEINQYLETLLSVPSSHLSEITPLPDILRRLGQKHSNLLITVLNSIRAASLAYMVDKRKIGIRSLMVNESQLLAILGNDNGIDGYSVPVVAKLLSVNAEFVYEIVNQGILLSEPGETANTKLINSGHLRLFQDEFVLLSKLSKVMELGSQTLMAYLAARYIYPIDKYREKKLRQKVYRRSDLAQLPFFEIYISDKLDWV
ncbi:TniQ family protein [Rheinheimera pacifica]|uniref:TniQ family protein n=1 Tax=Rheinheimera pacifica TaxID=173990 RepID=UPI00216A2991|nr:TniQ family protein [Rheinheimera pacifica]